jgi:hypothetical protein
LDDVACDTTPDSGEVVDVVDGRVVEVVEVVDVVDVVEVVVGALTKTIVSQ